jgi:hypothetical protein
MNFIRTLLFATHGGVKAAEIPENDEKSVP